jgi:hypothetical protein
MKKHLYDKILRATEISAESTCYPGVSEETEGLSGKFFILTTEEEPALPSIDKEAAYKLWAKSVEMTGIEDIISKA